jgi:hypothetical protein
VIACGQQSLKVFCVGLFLSFAAHFVLEIGSGSVWAQILMSAVGLFLMSAVARLACWFKRIEKPRPDLALARKIAVSLAPKEPRFLFPVRDLPARAQWLDSVQRPFPDVPRLPRSHALVSRH